VLLQVLLHAQIASEAQEFTLAEVAQNLAEKLIRRHPHVFDADGSASIDTPEAVTQQWQAIKAQEKTEKNADASARPSGLPGGLPSVLSGVSTTLPMLEQAAKLSKKAVKVGFAWPNNEALWQCVQSEFDEFWHEATAPNPNPDALEDELGDMLFATATLAQHYGIHPEVALIRATQKFKRRFQAMEQLATEPLESLNFDEWDALWKRAKQQVQTN
jgi:MazG family protein